MSLYNFFTQIYGTYHTQNRRTDHHKHPRNIYDPFVDLLEILMRSTVRGRSERFGNYQILWGKNVLDAVGVYLLGPLSW